MILMPDPKIYILLSTYRGEKYLHELLVSIQKQTFSSWKLIFRDDNSNDKSYEIVKNFFKDDREKLLILKSSKNIGAKESFNLLLKEALQQKDCDYIMFADQDDVWKKDKIELTLSKMNSIEKEESATPILVHTDLHVSDENLNIINNSLWSHENNNPSKSTLNYLFFQNTATGCTMMINRELASLACPIAKEAIMHDWWINMVASKFGKVAFVDTPTIFYRQHGANTIGAKGESRYSLVLKISNLLLLRNEPYLLHLKPHRKQAKAFLDTYHDKLAKNEISMLEFFISLPQKSWFEKRTGIIKYHLFRQSFIQNIGLFLRV
jgi:glycosyltransferase involved in cell wall biosynthesis